MSDPDRTSVLVRFPDDLLGRIERWQAEAAAADPPRPGTRHKAILELIEAGLGFDPVILAQARAIIKFREQLAKEVEAFQKACLAAGERMRELLNE